MPDVHQSSVRIAVAYQACCQRGAFLTKCSGRMLCLWWPVQCRRFSGRRRQRISHVGEIQLKGLTIHLAVYSALLWCRELWSWSGNLALNKKLGVILFALKLVLPLYRGPASNLWVVWFTGWQLALPNSSKPPFGSRMVGYHAKVHFYKIWSAAWVPVCATEQVAHWWC